jgi:hypothetical protein
MTRNTLVLRNSVDDMATLETGDCLAVYANVTLKILYLNSFQDCDFALAEDEDGRLFVAMRRLQPRWCLLTTGSQDLQTMFDRMDDAGVPSYLIVRVLRTLSPIR